MALSLRTDKIVAVYALSQWHVVKKGSFVIDTYELIDDPYSHEYKDRLNFYLLGKAYPEIPLVKVPQMPGTLGEHWHFQSPQGADGCQWVDAATGNTVSMSLLEIKAWCQSKDEESI
jgi:hypothetical protein